MKLKNKIGQMIKLDKHNSDKIYAFFNTDYISTVSESHATPFALQTFFVCLICLI